jgi:hypothetical protein
MILILSPQRGDTPLAAHRTGDTLTLNGEVLDFAPLAEGALLPRGAIACDWIAGDVTRVGGVLHVHLILPHGADAPYQSRFPAVLTLTGDGPVPLPPHDAAPEGQA